MKSHKNAKKVWDCDSVLDKADVWPGDYYRTMDGRLFQFVSFGLTEPWDVYWPNGCKLVPCGNS